MNLAKLVGHRIILTIQGFDYQDREVVPRIIRATNRSAFSMVVKVIDYDNLGIWIEHLNYPLYDEEKKRVEKHTAHVLIKYEFITSIAAFPSADGTGMLEEHKIGFDIDND